jgi:hypothetical protein
MLLADCDLRETVRAKYGFDSVGHYSREEALMGTLKRARTAPSQDPDDERWLGA